MLDIICFHRNIVGMHGVTIFDHKTSDIGLVMELMPRGGLDDLIRKKRY